MNARRWACLWALAGLLAAVPALVGWGRASAQDQDDNDSQYQTEEVKYQNNPEIKCLPYVQVSKQVPKQVQSVVRTQQAKGCVACHKSQSPVAGREDKPKVVAATALLVNPLKQAVRYEAKVGGGDWQTFTLEPGKTKRFTHRYQHKFAFKSKTKKQRQLHRSPEVRVRYDFDGQQHEKTLQLVATPQKKFGNVYYFKKKRDDLAVVSTPKKMKMFR
jgi:hypothetical protein